MISTCGAVPVRSSTALAARTIARTCISYTSGHCRPSRQPRVPSIGFASCSSPMRRRIASEVASSSAGRNSCRGGSSSRIVTGKPAIASKMPSKSDCCIGSN